jgi:tRNA (guanine26-N2/guanine27-N2)-dimethyltransferase
LIKINSPHIIANDMDSNAVKLIDENLEINLKNDVNERVKIIKSNCGDAIATMHKLKAEGTKLDVIDLDPYGSAAPFLDSAVQCISDGGLLCITCTDKVVLCSSHYDTCFSRYGGIPVNGDSCHEAVS